MKGFQNPLFPLLLLLKYFIRNFQPINKLKSDEDFKKYSGSASNSKSCFPPGVFQLCIQLTGHRTALLISHRLGITGLVDRILVFREGRIVEDGSHGELMARRGHYYAMYQAQAKWYQ